MKFVQVQIDVIIQRKSSFLAERYISIYEDDVEAARLCLHLPVCELINRTLAVSQTGPQEILLMKGNKRLRGTSIGGKLTLNCFKRVR